MSKTSKTVGLYTVGCKLNQYETEGVAELFEDRGFEIVPFDDVADVYVVNTCTVTGRSDYRSRQMIRRAARTNPGALVVATGCYAHRDPDPLASMPEVDLVVGNADKPRLAELVERGLVSRESGSGGTSVHVSPFAGGFPPFDIRRFRGHTRAFVKIQDGCDRRCTYCAVPDARGPARSRPFEEAIAQVERLVENGYREIVLTGVHVGSYEDELGRRLADLLSALIQVEDLVRVRLGSVEPTELTADLADAIVTSEKICNHLHVPLESGSDRVLESMGRSYSRHEYGEAVRLVTDRYASCGLGCDVMVGFPGEGDEDFADTVDLVESLPFTYLHVFSFSPRKGTAAALMEGRVPAEERKRRSLHLRELGRRKSLSFRKGLTGRRVEMLVEDRDSENGLLTGLAANYVRIEAPGPASLRNRFVETLVTRADAERTLGEIDAGKAR